MWYLRLLIIYMDKSLNKIFKVLPPDLISSERGKTWVDWWKRPQVIKKLSMQSI